MRTALFVSAYGGTWSSAMGPAILTALVSTCHYAPAADSLEVLHHGSGKEDSKLFLHRQGARHIGWIP